MNGEIHHVWFSPSRLTNLTPSHSVLPGCIVEIHTLTLKFLWKSGRMRIVKNNFKNEKSVGEFALN